MLAHISKQMRRGAIYMALAVGGPISAAWAEETVPTPEVKPASERPQTPASPMPPDFLFPPMPDDRKDGGKKDWKDGAPAKGSKSEVPSGGDERRGGRRSMSPERLQQFWESLSEEERQRFIENKERWEKMPPEEKRDLIQRHMRSASRVNREVDQILEQSGAEFSEERKAQFSNEYQQKRRDLEHEIAKKMDELRSEGIPKLLEEMRAQFPELGDTQFTDIGKRRRDKDGADGMRPERGPESGMMPPPPGDGGMPPGAGMPPLIPTGNGPGPGSGRPLMPPPPVVPAE